MNKSYEHVEVAIFMAYTILDYSTESLNRNDSFNEISVYFNLFQVSIIYYCVSSEVAELVIIA